MTDFFKNDFFKAYQDFAKDFSKDFQGFKPFQGAEAFQAPQIDVNKLFSLQRKNIEAFSAASKALNEGAQAIARRSSEFVRDNMEDVLSASRNVASSSSAPDKALAKHVEFTKGMMKNSAEQLREVSEMLAETQMGAFEILRSRMTRSVEEAKEFTSKKPAKKAA